MKTKNIIFSLLLISSFFIFNINTFVPSQTIQWETCERSSFTSTSSRSSLNKNQAYNNIIKQLKNFINYIPNKLNYNPDKHKNLQRFFEQERNKTQEFAFNYYPDYNFKDNENKRKNSNNLISKLKNFIDKFPTYDSIDKKFGEYFQKYDSLHKGKGLKRVEYYSKVQCSLAKVPLKWNTPSDNRYVYSFAKRFKSRDKTKGQVWFLQGGPGGDSTVFESIVYNLAIYLNYEYDIYLIDHRGVGRSSQLSCLPSTGYPPETLKSFTRKCTDLYKQKITLDALREFSTSNAALDLAYYIETTRKEDPDISTTAVYGVSYGTFWLNRLLTLKPNLVDIAIADSVVTPGHFDFTDWDSHYPEVGEELIKECEGRTDCSSKFTQFGGVREAFKKAFEKTKNVNTRCDNYKLLNVPTLRMLFSLFLQGGGIQRRLILPIIYRINRCSSTHHDSNFLDNVFNYANAARIAQPDSSVKPKKSKKLTESVNFEFEKTQDPKYMIQGRTSNSLYSNIVCSEIVKNPLPSPSYYINNYEKKVPPYFYTGASRRIIAMCEGMGTDIYNEPLKNQMANISHTTHMLSLQGTLDPQTPYIQSQFWKNHFGGRVNQHFVSVKNSYHGVAFVTLDDRNLIVGLEFMTKFIKDKSLPDVKMFENYVDYKIDYSSKISSVSTMGLLLGITDLWVGGPPISYLQLAKLFQTFFILILLFILLLVCCCCCLIFCCVALCIIIPVIIIMKKRRVTINQTVLENFIEPGNQPPQNQQQIIYNPPPPSQQTSINNMGVGQISV